MDIYLSHEWRSGSSGRHVDYYCAPCLSLIPTSYKTLFNPQIVVPSVVVRFFPVISNALGTQGCYQKY